MRISASKSENPYLRLTGNPRSSQETWLGNPRSSQETWLGTSHLAAGTGNLASLSGTGDDRLGLRVAFGDRLDLRVGRALFYVVAPARTF